MSRRQLMRTLAIMHSDAAAGPPQHVFPWLAQLAESSRVDVLVPAPGSAADLFATIGQVSVLDYRRLTYPRGPRALLSLGLCSLREITAFRRHITWTDPDLVLIVTSTLPAALVAARLEKRSVIVYVGEILDKGFSRGRGHSLRGAAVRRVLGRADALVCCSDAVARQFSNGTTCRVVTVHPGVSSAYRGGDGASFRAAHGLTDAGPCLAVVGNVTRGRGQDLVIRALPLIRRHLRDVHCVVAGAPLGPHPLPVDLAYRRVLGELASEVGVEDRVAFVGVVDRMADLYAAADIVVNPARLNESFGRVALEAMSVGRPVIAARVGAIPEVLRDEREALLVDPDDHRALAAAVVRLWTDRDLRERLVRAGMALASRFSEDAGTEAFAAVVDDLLRAAPASRRFAAVGARR